jgi:hypothetical protein
MGAGRPNSQPFLKTLAEYPCRPAEKGHIALIELRPKRLGLPHLPRQTDAPNLERTRIDNPHVDGMLLGQVVKDNVVRVTDLYSPGRDTVKNAGNSSVAEAVRSSASPRLPSPAVTAAAASNLISTQSRRNNKDCTFSAAWHPAMAGCHFLSTSNPI